jgi:hypothetical protein
MAEATPASKEFGTLRWDEKGSKGSNVKMLLVVDGSSHSSMATKMLEALRLPPADEDYGDDGHTRTYLPRKNHPEQARWRLHQERATRVKGVWAPPGAAECILAAVKEYNPDIIAIGSRGLTGIESLF